MDSFAVRMVHLKNKSPTSHPLIFRWIGDIIVIFSSAESSSENVFRLKIAFTLAEGTSVLVG